MPVGLDAACGGCRLCGTLLWDARFVAAEVSRDTMAVNCAAAAAAGRAAGHVMGLATWKAVLSETGRCPFTKAPLRPDMLTVLTALNIDKHRDRIVNTS